jgi:hypothetical protein
MARKAKAGWVLVLPAVLRSTSAAASTHGGMLAGGVPANVAFSI